jgi:hypothetical protein
MGKGLGSAYDRWTISVVISDTYIPHEDVKGKKRKKKTNKR